MISAEVSELRARFKKEKNTFTRIAGCYVNEQKEIVCTFNESFRLLADDEMFKYLDIAAKTLSGKLGDALLEQEFSVEEEMDGECHRSLLALTKSGLTDDSLNQAFFEKVIGEFDCPEHYLILLFADRYDVPVRTKDNMQNDVSDQVYTYILCALCPVRLADPGLSYNTEKNAIGLRIRDWVVEKPEAGFLFPGFTDRSMDIHTALVYSRDPKEPHREIGMNILGVGDRLTASEQRNRLKAIVMDSLRGDSGSDEVIDEIHYSFSEEIKASEELMGEGVTVPLDEETLDRVLADKGLGNEKAEKIRHAVLKELGERDEVTVNSLLDGRRSKAGERTAERKELLREIDALSGGSEAGGSGVVRAFSKDAVVERQEVDGEICFVIRNAEKLFLNGKEIE